jgi:hypothetical protein
VGTQDKLRARRNVAIGIEEPDFIRPFPPVSRFVLLEASTITPRVPRQRTIFSRTGWVRDIPTKEKRMSLVAVSSGVSIRTIYAGSLGEKIGAR